MATVVKKTNTERITELEEILKNLAKERNNLKRYEQLKEQMDDTAAQLAIAKDSLVAAGFTEEQAFEMLLKMLPSTNSHI